MDRFNDRWKSGSRHADHQDNQRFNKVEQYISNRIASPLKVDRWLVKINTHEKSIKAALDIILGKIDLLEKDQWKQEVHFSSNIVEKPITAINTRYSSMFCFCKVFFTNKISVIFKIW